MPFHKLPYSFHQRHFRTISEITHQSACIRKRLIDVALLHGCHFKYRFFAYSLLQRANEIHQLHGLRTTDVVNRVRWFRLDMEMRAMETRAVETRAVETRAVETRAVETHAVRLYDVRRFCHHANYSLYYVVDVCEVATQIAVVEYLYRLAVGNGVGEKRWCHVGTTVRTVNREET